MKTNFDFRDLLKKHNIDASRLGRKTSSKKYRLFLAYDKRKGWNIVKLTAFQCFLRRCFHCYSKKTHLSLVIKKLSYEQDVPESLKSRMRRLWYKTYPLDACPLPPKMPAPPKTN